MAPTSVEHARRATAWPTAQWPEEMPALRPARMHEVAGPAARAFAAAVAATRAGPVMWISPARAQERPDPYGLAAFFDPGRLLMVEAPTPADIFWAMEEAMRSGAAPLVAAECASPADLTQSRRLQLAAEAGAEAGAAPLGLALIPEPARANAAETRWRAEPLAPQTRLISEASANAARVEPTFDAASPDQAAQLWRWRLLKNKRGPTGAWTISWGAPAAGETDGACDGRSERCAAPNHEIRKPPNHLSVVAASGGRTGLAA